MRGVPLSRGFVMQPYILRINRRKAVLRERRMLRGKPSLPASRSSNWSPPPAVRADSNGSCERSRSEEALKRCKLLLSRLADRDTGAACSS